MANSNITSPIANPSATKAVLDKFGLGAKKSFGQNFLINDAIIRKICDLASVCLGDKIIEVGPGLGTLTLGLLKKGAHVFAVEKDEDMVNVLRSNVDEFCADKSSNFTVVCENALKIDKKLVYNFFQDSSFKLVSNLPYNVAAPIVISFFQTFDQLKEATVMVQKEIADRISAVPGTKNYGAYTVKLSFFVDVVDKFKVSANNFLPAPRVESAVVKLVRKHDLDHALAMYACEVVDAAFAYRRKTIANSIKQFYCDDFDKASAVLASFEKNQISTSLRAETLTNNDYIAVAKTLLAKRGRG